MRSQRRRITIKEKWYAEGKLCETEFLHSMNSYWAMLQFYQSDGLRRDLLGCYLDE